jgi:hypothetical protein
MTHELLILLAWSLLALPALRAAPPLADRVRRPSQS